MVRCGTFEKLACWNSYLFAGLAAGGLFSISSEGTIDDRYCPDAEPAVSHPDVPGRASDPRVRRIPWRAASAQPRAARRWTSGAGAAGPRGLGFIHARVAHVSVGQ